MSMINERTLEINFSGGRTLKFKFPVQARDENAAQRIDEALKRSTLAISANDKLYVIPTSAIETITVSPGPKKLPRAVIRGATLA
jgi:hypothetical protein